MAFYVLRADGVVNTRQVLCTRVTSNTYYGAAVQIRSALGQMTSTALGRTSAFPATAQTGSGASITLNIGNLALGINTSTEAYGFCIDDTNGWGNGSSTPGFWGEDTEIFFPTDVEDGICTKSATYQTDAQHFRTLTNTFQNVWTSSTAVYRGYANILLKAAVTATTPADSFYADTITVIAYATY